MRLRWFVAAMSLTWAVWAENPNEILKAILAQPEFRWKHRPHSRPQLPQEYEGPGDSRYVPCRVARPSPRQTSGRPIRSSSVSPTPSPASPLVGATPKPQSPAAPLSATPPEPPPPLPPAPQEASWVAQAPLLSLGLVLGATMLVALSRWRKGRRSFQAPSKPLATSLSSLTWQSQWRDAEQRQDVSLAYAAVLSYLAQGGHFRTRPDWTNREFLSCLSDPKLRQSFESLVQVFEEFRFGENPLEFSAFQPLCQEVLKP